MWLFDVLELHTVGNPRDRVLRVRFRKHLDVVFVVAAPRPILALESPFHFEYDDLNLSKNRNEGVH